MDRQKEIALYVPLVIGAASGPFVFRAAGFTELPRLQVLHFIIIVCYSVGAIMILRAVTLRLLRCFGNRADEQ